MNKAKAINILKRKSDELDYSAERSGIENERELRMALPQIIKLIEELK